MGEPLLRLGSEPPQRLPQLVGTVMRGTQGLFGWDSKRPRAAGPAGKSPLVRAMRQKQPDLRKAACLWLDRFSADRHAAVAELIALVMAVADVPSQTTVMKEDLQDRSPQEVVTELTAALALEASEQGADFSQHWLVSREKGAARVRENFPGLWRELVLAPSADSLQALVQLLRAWSLSLAECQFRSLRHGATVAGLGVVEGLQIQCSHLRDWCATAERRLEDTEARARSALSKELKQNRECLETLAAAKDSFVAALLSRRCKDVEPEIRSSCAEAMQRWAESSKEAEAPWKQYLHFAMNDPAPKVRQAALQALVALLGPEAKSLAEDVRPRVLARCHDTSASVAGAALGCAGALAALEVLKEEDFDPIIDLIWDPEAARRDGAARFVSRFILAEDVLDYPPGGLPNGALMPSGGPVAKRRLQMLLQFLCEFAGTFLELSERLVAALWRKASCIEDWEQIKALMLGESLPLEQHNALAFLAEATVRLAFEDWLANRSPLAEAVLERAGRALGRNLGSVLSAFQAEKAAMRRAASLCSYLLRFCALSGKGVVGEAAEESAEALRKAFLRQADPEALEHLALALAQLLELSPKARPVVHELAKGLRQRFLQLAPLVGQGEMTPDQVPLPDSLLATAQHLRILAKAYDVSLCDMEGFVSAALGLVDERLGEKKVSAELTVVLLELLALLSLRFAAQLMKPPMPCVAADPRDDTQLKQAPTATEDLLELATGLLERDPCPRVRSAALGAALLAAGAWWNAAHFAKEEAKPWVCSLGERLGGALAGHLGQLLAEANTVPADCAGGISALEPGDLLRTSAFSQLFAQLQQGLASVESVPSDVERVQTARLCCLLVAGCRHPEVAASSLPSLVLSLPLSPREDLQEVAWVFLRRLRREAHLGAKQAEDFFTTLLAAVKVVHQDNGTSVAKELSSRLLQHVGVGKLTPSLQLALLAALRRGISAAGSGEQKGFLEALTPWVTKHVVEDNLLQDLASWAESQSNEALAMAGLEALLAACRSTCRKQKETPEKPSKRRRTSKGGRQTPTSTQELRDAVDLEKWDGSARNTRNPLHQLEVCQLLLAGRPRLVALLQKILKALVARAADSLPPPFQVAAGNVAEEAESFRDAFRGFLENYFIDEAASGASSSSASPRRELRSASRERPSTPKVQRQDSGWWRAT
ncbi:unnamed protein product, partial [Effrenium voratum]